VKDLFTGAIIEYGVPMRVRCDKGGENVDVASIMLAIRGIDSDSVITGRSVHNQRIERLWRDLFLKEMSFYKSLFERLQYAHNIDFSRPIALFCLHYLFLDKINGSLQEFKESWNNHKLSTEACKTPEQLNYMYRSISQAVPFSANGLEAASEIVDWNGEDGSVVEVHPVACPLSENNYNVFRSRFRPFASQENDEDFLLAYFVDSLVFCELLAQ
jgi:hypothetical protein